jgi:hypothetical protein
MGKIKGRSGIPMGQWQRSDSLIQMSHFHFQGLFLGSVAGCGCIANGNHSHEFSPGLSKKLQNVILEVPRKSRLVGGASHEARHFQVFQL